MITAIIILFVYFAALFIAGTAQRNNSIVDVGWGAGFVLLAWLLMIAEGTASAANVVVSLMISVWGVRLSVHIARRNMGKPEDFRYQNFRKAWGKWVVPRAFLQVYMLQGVFMFIISLPVILMPQDPPRLSLPLLIIGLAVFIAGFLFEAIGDRQLKAFINTPANKGKIMTQGLWRYTRHPNYFGETVIWWGVYLAAISGGVTPLAIVSPVTITMLLLFVSGVPMLEKAMKKRPGYTEYAARTSVFFPWFPKHAQKEDLE